MKRFIVAAVAVVMLLSVPAFAQTYDKGDQELGIEFNFSDNDNDGRDTTGAVEAFWLYYATPKIAIGGIVTGVYTEEMAGQGLGAYWEYNFNKMKMGNFFLGVDGQYLAGDFEQVAAMSSAARIGYKLHIGDTAKVRFSASYTALFSTNEGDSVLIDDAIADAESLALKIGVSFKFGSETAVN